MVMPSNWRVHDSSNTYLQGFGRFGETVPDAVARLVAEHAAYRKNYGPLDGAAAAEAEQAAQEAAPAPAAANPKKAYLKAHRNKVTKTKTIKPVMLAVLAAAKNGEMPAKDAVAAVRAKLHKQLTPLDLQPLPSNPTVARLTNKVQWAAAELKSDGLLTSPKWGVWALTTKGRAAASKAAK